MIIKYRSQGATAFKSLNFESQSVELWDIIQRIVKENKMDQTLFEFELIMYDGRSGTEISDYHKIFTTEVELEYKMSKPRAGMSSYQAIVKNPNLLKVKVSAMELPKQKVETEEEKIQNTINGMYQPQSNKIEALFNPNKMKVRTIPPVNAIPPKSYICKKCKKPGHYVYRCPYGSESLEAQISHVKFVGIPLKNLTIIEDPSSVTAELRRHIGQLPDGRYAIQKSKIEDFEKDITNTAAITQTTNIDMLKVPDELKCCICKKLLREAVRTFCCGKLVCDECARQDIVNHNGKCSLCHNLGNNEQLIGDNQVRKKVNEYIKTEMSKINEEEKKNGVKLFENEDEIPMGERVEGGVDNIIPLNKTNNNSNNKIENNNEDDEEDDVTKEINEIISNDNPTETTQTKTTTTTAEGKKTISLDDLIFNKKTVCAYCNSQNHSIEDCPIRQKEKNNKQNDISMRNSIPFLLAPPPQSPHGKYDRSSSNRRRDKSRSRSRHSSHHSHYHSHSRTNDDKKKEEERHHHHNHRHEYVDNKEKNKKEENKNKDKEKEREKVKEIEKDKDKDGHRDSYKRKHEDDVDDVSNLHHNHKRRDSKDSYSKRHSIRDDNENKDAGKDKLKEYISKGDVNKSSDSKKPPISTKMLRELRKSK